MIAIMTPKLQRRQSDTQELHRRATLTPTTRPLDLSWPLKYGTLMSAGVLVLVAAGVLVMVSARVLVAAEALVAVGDGQRSADQVQRAAAPTLAISPP